jgi:hypothetical protein
LGGPSRTVGPKIGQAITDRSAQLLAEASQPVVDRLAENFLTLPPLSKIYLPQYKWFVLKNIFVIPIFIFYLLHFKILY